MTVLTTASAKVNGAIAQRRDDTSLVPPSLPAVALAGVIAAVVSVAASFGLAQLGRAVFTVPAIFDKFNLGGYGVLTVGGVIGATVAWALVSRFAPAPRQLLGRLAILVTLVLLLPDVWLFTQAGNPTGPVVDLMVMHVAIGIISYYALVVLAPVRSAASRG